MKHDHHIPIVDIDCIKLCRCLAICLEIIRKTTSVKMDNVSLFARLFDRLRLKLTTFVQFAKFNICARNLQQYCVPLVAEDLYSVLTNNEVDRDVYEAFIPRSISK